MASHSPFGEAKKNNNIVDIKAEIKENTRNRDMHH